jgi:hypothetical protein
MIEYLILPGNNPPGRKDLGRPKKRRYEQINEATGDTTTCPPEI